MQIGIKRVYQAADARDGFRVLVDRLWPRGLSKQKAALDLWAKDIAPSNELREWYGHDQDKWPEFRSRYRAELKGSAEALQELTDALTGHTTVTLLYAAKDQEHNNAVVLREWLKARL